MRHVACLALPYVRNEQMETTKTEIVICEITIYDKTKNGKSLTSTKKNCKIHGKYFFTVTKKKERPLRQNKLVYKR